MSIVLDMMYHKGWRISFDEPKITEYIADNWTLLLKKGVKEDCREGALVTFCSVNDCIKCENSDLKIIAGDTVIKDFKQDDNKEAEKYVIEFFDMIPDAKNLVEYLSDPDSDYRITRDRDKEILHYANRDIKKREENWKRSLKAKVGNTDEKLYVKQKIKNSKN